MVCFVVSNNMVHALFICRSSTVPHNCHRSVLGSIPSSLGDMTNLLWLYLNSNDLSGTMIIFQPLHIVTKYIK